MKIKTDVRLDPSSELPENGPGQETPGALVRHVPLGPPGAPVNGAAGASSPMPFDLWTVLEALKQRWLWVFLVGCLGAAAGSFAAFKHWKTTYTANLELVRYDSPNARELTGDRQLTPSTFATLLQSPEILRRVSERAEPPVTPQALTKRLRVIPERDSDVITVDLVGTNPNEVVRLAELYAEEAVRFTKNMQAQAAAEANHLVTQHLAQVDTEINGLNERLAGRPKGATVDGVSVSRQELARDELNELLERYTDNHPLVQAQRAKLAAMEKSGGGGSRKATNGVALPVTGGKTGDAEMLSGRFASLETARLALAERQRTFQMLQDNPPGYYQVVKRAAVHDLTRRGRTLKLILLGLFGGMAGLMAGGVLALGAEAMDNRLKNRADVVRVTGLPVLAAADDLYRMHDQERRHWAFRAWSNLQWHLLPSPNHSLVCGFTSADYGEGRSNWMELMGEAASQRGFRVLTIGTYAAAQAAKLPQGVIDASANGGSLVAERPASVVPLVLDSRLLAAPEEVLPQLTGPDQQAVLRIPLPGWVWSLQHRNQWREAVQQWSRLGNVVILVELPPATVPENLLLAESLPNVIWVSDCREANAAVTRRHVQTLRQSRCRLAGAVLSHARPSGLQERFARWLACLLLLWSWQQFPSVAAEEPSSPTPTPAAAAAEQVGGSFSALASTKRAAWQEQLTLGPGDLLNFSLFGQAELSRPDVAIAPDGTVSFLEAQNVMAAGLTIDQLRSRFDEELAKYRRAPRTMITPAAFRSKKYFMLGRVAQRGVFVLDRPMTIIEAVANAQGLETALVENHTMELADYSRSFLMRRGQRLAVNFEKLFQQGDLSQNVALEPNDYLYFPAATVREVYVLGEVLRPGPVAFRTGLGAVGAVAARGGFSEKAWRHKVLVVRGSLNKPEAFPINTADVVKARAADFKLEPRDIVYVSARPWIKVEEVLDAAATAFIEAVVITWGGKALF